ncbi:glycosyltransferase family 4 protein [Stappia sp. 28M-7]|uniref:glycosyltransferase family 4 protein n=1 Tax=Stappia sp. 28M-7 TaxID=2762596 RepID=UPI00163C8C57|nr:glycosyltransferase family 4 protein [Stappia sp. 28M-7]MBC2857811.1 glycosyltransferase family 4 protein [Stappia sp. 28M-7]
MTRQDGELHLVHVVRQYRPSVGGLEDFVASLAARQKDRFASVRIVTCDRVFRGGTGEQLPAREIIDGIEVIRLPWHGSTRYPVTPGIFKAIAGADLVHVHAIDFFFDALALAAPFHRRPLVATTHGGFFHSGTAGGLKTVWFNTLTRLSATAYRGIACCSQSDYERFDAIAPSKVRLIENGVDLSKLGDAGAKAPVKGIVSIGRLSHNKRIDRVLDAFAVLARRDPAWTLDIVGTPFDWSGKDVEAMIGERGLAGRARLHVGPDDAAMREIAGRASLFASASVYEGFGIALIEAMSAGLVPVVEPNAAFSAFAQRHPGIALTDFGDAEQAANALAAAHDRLAADPKGLREEVMAVAQTYSWESTAERYADFYREALGSSKR